MPENVCQPGHKKEIMAVHDAMDVLSGKWKISILSSICYYNERRFSDVLADVPGISNKMLSQELKELEANKLIKRKVIDSTPITVKYNLTEYGLTLRAIIEDLAAWGKKHREVIIED